MSTKRVNNGFYGDIWRSGNDWRCGRDVGLFSNINVEEVRVSTRVTKKS